MGNHFRKSIKILPVLIIFMLCLITGCIQSNTAKDTSYTQTSTTIEESSITETEIEELQVYYTTANLNVRNGPGTEYDIIDILQKGEKVSILSLEEKWSEIQYHDTTAFVSTKYLSDVEPQTEVQTKPQTESQIMVWIPRSGSKYHSRSSCSGMKGPSKVTLEQAQKRGYSPCKKCY